MLDESFTERKRQIQLSSERFNEKLRKVSLTIGQLIYGRFEVVNEKVEESEEKYEERVKGWEEKLQEAFEVYQKKQEDMEKTLGLRSRKR